MSGWWSVFNALISLPIDSGERRSHDCSSWQLRLVEERAVELAAGLETP
jgi:hypothetical protein